ncbi:MAG: hypothetical protein AB7O48_03305 [Cyclobacteriaceae bacterium]
MNSNSVLRLFLLNVIALLFSFNGFGQNKTLGVGVVSPNANAALHVESPTNNQGVIFPRLTTAQRTAMTLAAGDKGVTVYDTDLNSMLTWNGTAWASSAKLIYPYADNFTSATGTPDLFKLSYDNAENKRVVRIENNNTTNGSSALSVLNLGTGIGGYFQVSNPTSPAAAVYGTTNSDVGGPLAPPGVYGEATGTGSLGGAFRISNAANTLPAIYSETNGLGSAARFSSLNTSATAPGLQISADHLGRGIEVNVNNATTTAAAIYANNGGNGFGLHAVANTTAFGASAVYGEQFGTGDAAGAFRINNTGNNFAALYGETNGSGTASSAVRGLNLGAGNGAYFRKNGSSVNTAAMWADNFGTDGYGAIIQNVDATNPTAALFVEAVGAGPSVWANKDTGENGVAIQALHNGTSGNAIEAINNGPGYALYARASGPTDAVYGVKEAGDGNGSAGNFWNNEPGNGAAALFAATNAAGGSAIGALNSAEGNAISVFQGGIKMSTHQATGGGGITVRAMAYTVDSDTYTFSFSVTEGETFYVFNVGAGDAIVEGATIPASEGRVFIMIGGVLRPF